MMKTSPYKILGIPPSATQAQVKAKFYELSKKYHPDRMRGETEEVQERNKKKFHSIKEAYETLSDPNKRASLQTHEDHYTNSGRSHDDVYGAHRSARDFYNKPPNFYRPPSGMRRTAGGPNRVYNYGRSYNRGKDGDPLNYGYRQPSNYDVPHFDFDRHYQQQQGYEKHRNRRAEEEEEKLRNLERQHRGGGFWSLTSLGIGIVSLATILSWLK